MKLKEIIDDLDYIDEAIQWAKANGHHDIVAVLEDTERSNKLLNKW